jgi:serine/threonine-protein phosphatase PPG1
MADLVWSDPDPEKEEFAVSARGAGYMFGSLVVERFLHMNSMDHILRAHQLCNAGYQVLFDDKLSTVWSAPNYCYRCGNLASILEVGVNGERYFNVFDAAPENERILDSNDTYGKVTIAAMLSDSMHSYIFHRRTNKWSTLYSRYFKILLKIKRV